MATALAGAVIACSLGAPAVSARPVEQFMPDAAGDAGGAPSPAPPPSSIAASAAEEYEDPRSPGRFGQAQGARPTTEAPVEDPPPAPNGFDVVSAAIGAAGGTGLVIVLLAGAGLARRRLRAAQT